MSCLAEPYPLVFTGLLISPGQMFVGLMNVDKAGGHQSLWGFPQLARAGQAKGSWEEASLAILRHLLLAALAGEGGGAW